jgi:hypothetical protein
MSLAFILPDGSLPQEPPTPLPEVEPTAADDFSQAYLAAIQQSTKETSNYV